MTPTRHGSFRLFRFAGIDVFLHWSWFAVAAFEIQDRAKQYSSLSWNALEYVALFLIVLMHEFGHALACRQVGGQANQIVLWPLGGVAYVSPPPRPGATLWSIAAGPLVNVALVPVLTVLMVLGDRFGWNAGAPNSYQLVRGLWMVNFVMLLFNLLPIYPLDGGQILRSLLWFGLGRARSLMVATVVGFAGVAVMILVAVLAQRIWIGVLSASCSTAGKGCCRRASCRVWPGCPVARDLLVRRARRRRSSARSGDATNALRLLTHFRPKRPVPIAAPSFL